MLSFPNAKINIGLNITEKRTDGYHNLETVFYPIPIKDSLELITNKNIKSPYTFHNSGIKVDSAAEENICIKALLLLEEQFNIPNLDIYLHKAIPFGAGLGGGSANGAFMLKMLNEYFKLNLNNEQLATLASKLGADCPFFIYNSPVLATGIGDQLKPVDLDLSDYYLYLVKPPIHVSTPEAYAGITATPSIRSLDSDIMLPVEQWKDYIINDFETSVFLKHPTIGNIKERLYNEGAIYAAMSGSGSAVYGLFKEPVKINFDPSYFTWFGQLK